MCTSANILFQSYLFKKQILLPFILNFVLPQFSKIPKWSTRIKNEICWKDWDMSGLDKEKWTIILAFAAIYIVWGSTYLAILIGLNDIPPFLMSAIRFLLAGIILHIWCQWKGESLPSREVIVKNSIAGILMLVGGTVSVAWAEQYLSSSMAAIIGTILPFWFVVLDSRQWKFYFRNKSILTGLFLGFAGVCLLLGFGSKEWSLHQTYSSQLQGIIVILLGGVAWTS